MAKKPDPVKSADFQRVVQHFLTTKPKPHKPAPAPAKKKKIPKK